MSDTEPMSLSQFTARQVAERAERLALPALALTEWALLHGVPITTARSWAAMSVPPMRVWRSGGCLMIRPDEPVPALPRGRPAGPRLLRPPAPGG